jgi:hypothetical protein
MAAELTHHLHEVGVSGVTEGGAGVRVLVVINDVTDWPKVTAAGDVDEPARACWGRGYSVHAFSTVTASPHFVMSDERNGRGASSAEIAGEYGNKIRAIVAQIQRIVGPPRERRCSTPLVE